MLATGRNPARLRDVWEGWHTISAPYKKDYVRFVELSNNGARELGYADTGAMWRSKYDMPPGDFAREMDRLWEQLRPLYVSLHTHVRARLRDKYGDEVPADGADPGPPARQYLGAGVVKRASTWSRRRRTAAHGRQPRRHPQGPST